SYFLSKMKEHRFSLPFTSFGGEQCISPMKSFCLKQYSLRGTLTRVATVSGPIVAETRARRGAGFSRFLQLIPGEGESQTTGKLCVLHFFYKGLLNIASPCMNSKTAQLTEMGQTLSVCSHGLRWELPFYLLWLIVLACGGHMEQRTYPGEISLISWNTRVR